MTDLYELTDHAAGWRMPIRVHWHNEALAEVTLADVPILAIQWGAIMTKLHSVCTHFNAGSNPSNPKERTWWIPKLSLQPIATKSNETDPERIVRWNQPEPDLAADADFVNAYCKQRGAIIKNPKTLEILLGSLNEFMLQWLVSGRPINFGWGRLDAFPVRANWKNAMIGRIFKNRKYVDHYTAEQYDFFRTCILANTEWLTAYDLESATMRWSAEFTPSEKFHEAAKQRELERKKNPRWKNNYLGQVLKYLRDNIERLHANLISYSKETDFPFAIFPDGSSPRNPPKGFQPVRSTSAWYQVPLVTAAAAKGHEGSALVQEDAGVSKVQDLRPEAPDVRQRDTVDAAREG